MNLNQFIARGSCAHPLRSPATTPADTADPATSEELSRVGTHGHGLSRVGTREPHVTLAPLVAPHVAPPVAPQVAPPPPPPEIDRYLHRLTARGMRPDAVYPLAQRLMRRDREDDDRRHCQECARLTGTRCAKRLAVVDVLWRCDSFVA